VTAKKPVQATPAKKVVAVAKTPALTRTKAAPKPVQTAKKPEPVAEQPFWLDPSRRRIEIVQREGEVALILKVAAGQRVNYETFLLEGKRRVVDLKGLWRYDGDTVRQLDHGPLSRVRIGEHPDKLRIVFDYEGAELGQPKVETTPGGVSMIFFWG
jgi:hypothetical protein